MTVWRVPLNFESNITEKEITVSIQNNTYIFFFQYNAIDTNLYLSVYTQNKTIIYFGSYRCVFGNYINKIDNGLPYLIFFMDESGTNLEQIDFTVLNQGVSMYVQSR